MTDAKIVIDGKEVSVNECIMQKPECVFCKHDPEVSDDESEFLSDLRYQDIKMNDVTVGRMFLSMESRAERGAYLDVELFGMPSGQPQIADIKVPIHYCPFCGRELN